MSGGSSAEAHGEERRRVLAGIAEQLRRIEGPGFTRLIPEVGSNLAYALPGAESSSGVAAVPGRIRNAMGRPVFLPPAFGASSHLASMLMEILKRDPAKRCVLNVRYSEETVRALRSMGRVAVFVDRMKEPPEVSKKEGASVPWVIVRAIEEAGRVPDAVYHRGTVGKEAMILLIGSCPAEVVDTALGILSETGRGMAGG